MMGKLRDEMSCMSAHLFILKVRIIKKAEYPQAKRKTPSIEASTEAAERFETCSPKGIAKMSRIIDCDRPKRTVPRTLVSAIVVRDTGATRSRSRYPPARS